MRIDTPKLRSLIRNASLAAVAVIGLSVALPAAADAGVRIRARVLKPRVVVAPRVVVKTVPVTTTVVVKPAKPAQGKYVWVEGRYVKKPGCRRVWIAGHWRRIG